MRFEPIVLVLMTLVSAGGLKWCFRVIIEAIANSKRIKILRCDNCGELVHFDPPIKAPTRADLYGLAGEIAVAVAGGAAGAPVEVEQLAAPLPDRVRDS
jgi:hypothetical protein